MPKAIPSIFYSTSYNVPEYVAVILASSTGSRLFPVTSHDMPKHMMPICGTPVLQRLLVAVEASGFLECVIVLAHDDVVTIPFLKQELLAPESNQDKVVPSSDNDPLAGSYQITGSKPHLVLESTKDAMKITVLVVPEDCQGSIGALRQVEEAAIVPDSSNMVVLPGDLVVFGKSVLCDLCDKHRQGGEITPSLRALRKGETIKTACTVLLTDVGEQDEHGVPLKESAKVKSGRMKTCAQKQFYLF